MKRLLSLVMSVFLMISAFFAGSMNFTTVNAMEANSSTKEVVVYFPNWGTYSDTHQRVTVSDIPWEKITVVNHAFFTVSKDFKLVTTDPFADYQKAYEHSPAKWDELRGHLGEYKYFKSIYPQKKVLISVGGWTRSENFHDMAKTTASRKVFIDSCIDFMTKYPFIDGIDIDWEYPGVDRPRDTNDQYDKGSPGGPEDKENFTLLLKELRENFDSNSMSEKYLTIAAPAGYDKVEKQEPNVYHQYLNFINVMTYDMHGAWENVTHHHSPIYKNPNDPSPTQPTNIRDMYNTSAAMELYTNTYNVPADKLNVGSPFYSRGWSNVDDSTGENGLFANATGYIHGEWDDKMNPTPGGQEPWFKIKTMENTNGWVKYTDEYAKTPYLYNKEKKMMLTYEDEESLKERCKFINNNNYGGLIIWEISGDDFGAGYPMTSIAHDYMVKQVQDKLPLDAQITVDKEITADGIVKVSANIPQNSKADIVKLLVNNVEKEAKSVSNQVVFDLNLETEGEYIVKLRLENAHGHTDSNSIVIKFEKPVLKTPKLSVDKAVNFGDYTVKVDLEANTTANKVEFYEDNNLINTYDVVDNKVSNTFEFKVLEKAKGNYTYKAIALDKELNKKESEVLNIEVRQGSNSIEDFEITFDCGSSWETGHNFKFTMKNISDKTYKSYVLNFDYDGEIASIWSGGVLVSKDGKTYTVKNPSYINEIKPGDVISFGGQGKGAYPGVKPYNYILTLEDKNMTNLISKEAITNDIMAKEVADPNEFKTRVFAPYVDTCNYPLFNKEKMDEANVYNYVLAFLVAKNSMDDTPRWGGFEPYDLDYFKDEVNHIRANGGEVMVSFGGANGTPLAAACKDVQKLKDIYANVIDSYKLNYIDFDIEGIWVTKPESIERRSKAIKLLQDDPKYSHVKVWYTLPTLPSGPDVNGKKVLDCAYKHGVRLDGVNLMTMDYGSWGAPNPEGNMGNYAIDAGTNLFDVLKGLNEKYNVDKTDAEVWKMVGLTPMIGQNDVRAERFYQADAQKLVEFALQKDIGLLSMWSINRDKQDPNNPNNPQASADYSGVAQEPFEFSSIFKAFEGDQIDPNEPSILKAAEISVNSEQNTGEYTLSIKVPAKNLATTVSLYENNEVVKIFDVQAESDSVVRLAFDITNKALGEYNYKVITSDGTKKLDSNEVLVTVMDEVIVPEDKPGKPSIDAAFVDWDTKRDFDLKMSLWWGINGTSWKLYENDVVIEERELEYKDDKTAQFDVVKFTNKESGTYVYKAELINPLGSTFSRELTIVVK
ncbi:MAG: glycosyl hydrolase family 18 protein [Peptostreptococcaceae bacterium]|nr:glycosyl hydrolase family 18 protein [Peptostreptococcaceae bacterium]